MITNIFKPLFEVTLNPELDPTLFQFLIHLVGFDTVDDQSVQENLFMNDLQIYPENYDKQENPHYSYWLYYLYANIYSLNKLRKERGLNTYSFRPHCGQAGNINHLASSYLLADSINHGIKLVDSPVLTYLYYLKQIGLAISPVSNNK